jgi:hypothetical protein
MQEIDDIIGWRFVDKKGKLREELERSWQSLKIDVDTLVHTHAHTHTSPLKHSLRGVVYGCTHTHAHTPTLWCLRDRTVAHTRTHTLTGILMWYTTLSLVLFRWPRWCTHAHSHWLWLVC